MYKLLAIFDSLLGRLISLVILVALAVGGWFGFQAYYGDRLALDEAKRQVAKQQEELQAKQREIERLATAVRLLKVDRRVALIDVLGQQGSAAKGDFSTKFTFVEVDAQGKPLDQPKDFVIKGDIIYIDGWIIKFADEYIEQNDPLRSASLFLFRRIFGESQQPKDGFRLDQEGSEPAAYRSAGKGKTSDFERELWSRFWDYATDPAIAEKDGVRAAHGDAPYTKLIPGKRYRIELRSSDGLTIKPDDAPPRPADPAV